MGFLAKKNQRPDHNKGPDGGNFEILINDPHFIQRLYGKIIQIEITDPLFFYRTYGEMIEIEFADPLFFNYPMGKRLKFKGKYLLTSKSMISTIGGYSSRQFVIEKQNQRPCYIKRPHGQNASKIISHPHKIRPTQWGFGPKKNQRPGSYI